MNRSQILKKIGNIIEELSEQQQYLASTNKINLLELELFTANADFLIDHIEFLKKLNDQRYDGRKEDTPILNENIERPQVTEPKIQELSEEPVEQKQEKKFSFSFDDEPTEMIFDFEKKIAVEEVFDRPLNEDERRLLEEKTSAPKEKPEEFIVLDQMEQESANSETEEEDIEPFLLVKSEEVESKQAPENISTAPVQENHSKVAPVATVIPANNNTPEQESETIQPVSDDHKQKPSTLSQQFQTAVVSSEAKLEKKEERPLTLNEMLSAKLGQTSGQSHQRQAKKLEDLKAAISINDKMVFIKELFNGYNLAYSEAIEIVNRFESFEAADNFLQKNYSVKNDWESKQVTVARFYEYLHQKFVM